MRIAVEKLIGRRARRSRALSSSTQIELRFVFFFFSFFFPQPRSGAFRDNASLLYGNNSLGVSLNTKASATVEFQKSARGFLHLDYREISAAAELPA